MEDEGRYTRRAVRISRWYLRVAGLLVFALGVAVLVSLGTEGLAVAGAMAFFGMTAFLWSFARSGDDAVDAAREHLKVDAED